MAFNPAETLKKIPWEVWVGLLLTIGIGWIVTKQAVSAGQASAGTPTDVGVGTPSGQPSNVTPVGAASTTDMGTLSQQIGDLTASNQAALQQLANLAGPFGGNTGSASNSGTGAPQNGLPFRTAPALDAGGSGGSGGLVGTGSSAQGAYAMAAANSSGLAQNGGGGGGGIPSGHGPGGTYDAARQAAADIGSHMGIDSGGNVVTIQSTYANMTPEQKDQANAFAHQYPNGQPHG